MEPPFNVSIESTDAPTCQHAAPPCAFLYHDRSHAHASQSQDSNHAAGDTSCHDNASMRIAAKKRCGQKDEIQNPY